jgi:protein-S-isoprenylcysteine O-methyltransferase Ste14
MKGASLVGLLLMVGAAVTLLFRHAVVSHSPWGIAAQVAAVLLMIWARAILGRRSFHAAADPTEGGLVTTGPYRFIRHPIYTAVCLFCGAGVLANLSLPSIVAYVLLVVGALIRIVAEERLLVERYPDYRSYARGTKRIVPYVF